MSNPFIKPELITHLQQCSTKADTFWSSFTPDDFVARPGDRSWSPAQNVIHLIAATKPVLMALRLPRLLLRLLFGISRAPSRHYDNIVHLYHEVLANGGQASGKYLPKLTRMPPDVVEYQRQQIGTLKATVESLATALDKWSEQDLDRYQLPHPLLGRLTVREMLFFTMYHLEHHMNAVERKLAGTIENLENA